MKFKKLAIAALAAASTFAAGAETFQTQGTGVRFTLNYLAEVAPDFVTMVSDGNYTLAGDVIISEGDEFTIDQAEVLALREGATLELRGYGDFDATRDGAYPSKYFVVKGFETETPGGIIVDYNGAGDKRILFKHVSFDKAQLRNTGESGFDIDDCSFAFATGALSSSGALTVGPSGATFNISNTNFEHNEVPAIGGAANQFCGLNITGCHFYNNNTSNTNKPQLNLTVGGDLPVKIADCTILGTGLNMVGGIAVGNLLMGTGANEVEITGCSICDCRYGLTGVGPMNMKISDNTLLNNNHEDNPMNGGSGISLAGYNYGLNAVISGNRIENSLWGVTLIQCDNVSLGEVDNPDSPGRNVFVDNGNNGIPYDLYNNGANTVYAQLNTWSVPEQTAEQIETVIYHKVDNPSLGEVIFMPPYTPSGIELSTEAGTVTVHDIRGRYVGSMEQGSLDTLPSGLFIVTNGKASHKLLK